MRTPELYRSLGCTNNALHRLAERGILQPRRIDGTPGAGRWGYAFEWDEAEQRAARAVIMLARSLFIEVGRRSSTASEARDDQLRAVAEAARAEPSPGARWLMLLASGSCLLVDDEAAASWPWHRTLIPLGEIAR